MEYHQAESRIGALFIKINEFRQYSFQMYQKYISKITSESLQKLMVELNKIAIESGIEDVQSIRQDSTVVKTNIHHPTNTDIAFSPNVIAAASINYSPVKQFKLNGTNQIRWQTVLDNT